MKRYFVCSDVHGFYDEWMLALSNAGFDLDDPEHILIVCGDVFDRGRQPLDVYKFIKSLPRERRILVRGNHESLLKDMVERGYALDHDISNGTKTTVYDIAGIDEKKLYEKAFKERPPLGDKLSDYDGEEWVNYRKKIDDMFYEARKKAFEGRKLKGILKWIASDEWVDFAEIGKYVFVHAFIPLKSIGLVEKGYREDWRDASHEEWEDAKWGCPWKLYLKGLFKPEEDNGKILVCGHWHTSDFWNRLEWPHDMSKWLDVYESNPIYKSEKHPGIIGLDACTAATGVVNVLVLDEEDMR